MAGILRTRELLIGAASTIGDHSVPVLDGALLVIRLEDANTARFATADPCDTAGPF